MADLTGTVGTGIDLGQCIGDLTERCASAGSKGEVALSVDRGRTTLARLLVELHLERPVRLHELIGLRLELRSLLLEMGPLDEEQVALLLDERPFVERVELVLVQCEVRLGTLVVRNSSLSHEVLTPRYGAGPGHARAAQ
ncbi:hypothetical protein Afer_1211 [Acidimicrobium ferrooxidans DSM 10331]|uniref:Uncharacterized protein n=1 Tax=Acidimicrobium ferrooxidans (strain DSM 10331 / JCM 15462 / NBRC 103882 / ICP) TaxID=525909 RepID=C7LZI5_ACIFD|nr:hypothetical protein Afer_1211 [Acidimicrobium ferrooxidans DSM 10331]